LARTMTTAAVDADIDPFLVRRCQTEGCTKAAKGDTGHCVAHGGGRRCQTEGCTKSAIGDTGHGVFRMGIQRDARPVAL
jgi:hypothetical protein